MKATITMDGEQQVVTTVMTQWCPDCKMLAQATLVLKYTKGRHCADKSVCQKCGRVLWDWKWVDGPPLKVTEKEPEQLDLF